MNEGQKELFGGFIYNIEVSIVVSENYFDNFSVYFDIVAQFYRFFVGLWFYFFIFICLDGYFFYIIVKLEYFSYNNFLMCYKVAVSELY